MLPGYAELHCVSNYTFLRGASDPEELVRRAAELGYTALALTDECSVAGVVRAHVEARRLGLPLIVGAQMVLGGQTRQLMRAMGLRPVAGLTGRQTCVRVAPLVDKLAHGHELGVGRGRVGRLLRGIESRQRTDHRVIHQRDFLFHHRALAVTAGKVLELLGQICLGLARQTRERGGRTLAGGAVTGPAMFGSKTLRIGQVDRRRLCLHACSSPQSDQHHHPAHRRQHPASTQTRRNHSGSPSPQSSTILNFAR